MSLALLTLGVGIRVEAQMRPKKGRLERTAGLDLVDPLEEAEVRRDSRPASDDPGATFRGAALDDGEERTSSRLIRAEVDEDGQGRNEADRRCDPHKNVPSSPLRRRWLGWFPHVSTNS